MTQRRPVVNIGGVLQELPAADTLPLGGAAGGDLGGAYPNPSIANPLAALVAGFNRTGVTSGCSVGQHAAAAPTFVAEVHSGFSGGGSKTLTIPSSVAINDQMLLVANSWNNASLTDPSGWTLVDDSTGTGDSTARVRVWRKTAVSGDTGGSATVSVTFGSGGEFALAAYRTVDTTTPINVEVKQGSSATGTTATAPAVTTTLPNCMVVSIFGASNNGFSTTTITPPATNRVNVNAAGAFSALAISDSLQALAGTSTAATATVSNGSWATVTLALSPGSAANMSVDVAAGSVVVNGTTMAVSAASGLTVTASDTTNPRLDLVTADSSGTVAVVAGTPAAVPSYPATPANKAVLAVVAVAANASSVVNANITDLRITLASLPAGYGLIASRPSAAAAGDRAIWYATDTFPPVPYQVESGAWVPVGAATPAFDFLSAYTAFR